MGKGKGWHKESRRHSLARKGVKTVQPISKLNVDRYMGRWYQIKAFPKSFQVGCKKSIAEYEKKKGYINVKNICIDKAGERFIFGKAYTLNKGKSKLEVDFVGGRIFTGDYWVLYTDYQTALIGTPDKNSLWILSRKPMISKMQMQKLEKIAKEQGFDISRLR